MRSFILAVALSILLFGCTSQTQAPQGNSTNLTGGSAASLQQSSLQNNSSAVVLARGNPAPIPPPGPVYNYSLTRTGDGRLIVYYFYSSYDCAPCDMTRPLIERLESEYGNETEWRIIDLQNGSQSPAYWALTDYLNLTKCLRKIPFAFVNGTKYIGPYEINDSLGRIINGSI